MVRWLVMSVFLHCLCHLHNNSDGCRPCHLLAADRALGLQPPPRGAAHGACFAFGSCIHPSCVRSLSRVILSSVLQQQL
jgi:hypothetical protein